MNNVKTLQKYKGYPLYTDTVVPNDFRHYVELSLATEEEACNHTFHKVLINHWSEDLRDLISAFSNKFGVGLIPVNIVREEIEGENDILTFYTNNINLILKIIDDHYLFHYQKMCRIEIIFNHKTSKELFGKYTSINDIVSQVVCNRFTNNFKLDLTSFCQDTEFVENKIYFYKLSLLSHFKILMLRMGRDALFLDLSHNDLRGIPVDVLNFFSKKSLTAVNLSHNKIENIQEIFKLCHNLEKLWLEGNPLCAEVNPLQYVKKVVEYFPKLKELDGVKLNKPPFYIPFHRNYINTNELKTSYVIENFLMRYFAFYDHPIQAKRKHLLQFYHPKATFTVKCCSTPEDEGIFEDYMKHAENIVESTDPKHRKYCFSLVLALLSMPATIHDPTTFCVDVLHHTLKSLIFVVDGVFREKSPMRGRKTIQFRRTFVLSASKTKKSLQYLITNDMLSLRLASQELIDNSFLHPVRNRDTLMLVEPTTHDTETIVSIFCQLTKLKPWIAEERLRTFCWDLRMALITFSQEFKKNEVPIYCFADDETESVDLDELMDEID